MDQLGAAYAHNMNLAPSGDYPSHMYQSSEGGYSHHMPHPGFQAHQEGVVAHTPQQDDHHTAGQCEAATTSTVKVRRKKKQPTEEASKYPPNPDDVYFEKMTLGISLTAAEEAALISAPQPLIPPIEYTLRVHPEFYYQSADELVYSSLSDHQGLLIMDLIRQIRPYGADTIRKALGNRLKARLAREFLSGDMQRVEAAVEKFYPRDVQRKINYTHDNWMTGMTDDQRRYVIERIAAQTGQATDALREYFLKRDYTPEVAWEFVEADDAALMLLIDKYEPFAPVDIRALPWQGGASKIQKTAFLQRMTSTNISLAHARVLLQEKWIKTGYCLEMLRASEQEFRQKMGELRNVDLE
ncbi:hypothetical protein CBS101457_003005 [Exobasidium rhododendri]|nr:hypothetical protein CBS101457_003005 [Exobasidium rhododendri]